MLHTWVFGTEKVCRKQRETEFRALVLEELSLLLAFQETRSLLGGPRLMFQPEASSLGQQGLLVKCLMMYDVTCT